MGKTEALELGILSAQLIIAKVGLADSMFCVFKDSVPRLLQVWVQSWEEKTTEAVPGKGVGPCLPQQQAAASS